MNKTLRVGIQKIKLFLRVLTVQTGIVCSLSMFVFSADLKGQPNADEPSKDVSGKVVDDNNKPLPGANILIKGTSIGTTTDADGNYRIAIEDENSILVCSFVGFETQEIRVGAQTTVDFSLKADLTTL